MGNSEIQLFNSQFKLFFFFTLDSDTGPAFLECTLLQIPNKKNLDEQITDTLYSLWPAS